MLRYELVGGSQDGQTVELNGDQQTGFRLRVHEAVHQQSAEIYELREDGKFHFLAYGSPLVRPTDESS